jgi:hypothetical protein
VCVKGENCEYEHGRPLVVDEAGLSKLQSGRGMLTFPFLRPLHGLEACKSTNKPVCVSHYH